MSGDAGRATDYSLGSLGEMARLVACPDDKFDAAVYAAQTIAGQPVTGAFARVPYAKGQQLFELCLAIAQKEGWLDPLLGVIMDWRLDLGRLAQKLGRQIAIPVAPARGRRGASRPRAGDRVRLERKVRPLVEPGDPALTATGVMAAMGYTAQVEVSGKRPTSGTGFLVGPDLLMTAWHVIGDLLEPIPPQESDQQRPWCTHRPRAGTAGEIEVVFDNVRLLTRDGQELTLNRRKIKRIRVAREWFVCGRPVPQPSNRLPHPASFEDNLDYALLRLGQSVVRENGHLPWERCELPRKEGARLWIFQYEGKEPLIWDNQTYSGTYGDGQERFYYTVNTKRGASGGPCLDNEFRLVGMHLAGWKAKLPKVKAANLGVPIMKVYDHLRSTLGNLPPPLQQGVAVRRMRSEPYSAIVGRWDFQSLIWTEFVLGQARILTVSGVDCGFFAYILDSMLPPSNNLVVIVGAESIAKEPAETVHQVLMSELGPAGSADPLASAPEHQPPGSVLELRSTAGALSQDHLVPRLLDHANNLRAGRTVWIVLDQLDRVHIDKPASDYLYLLYRQAANKPWLRFVLLGFRGERAAFGEVRTLNYHKLPLTRDDIVEYLQYLIPTTGKRWSSDSIEYQAREIFEAAGDPEGSGQAEAIAAAVKAFADKLRRE